MQQRKGGSCVIENWRPHVTDLPPLILFALAYAFSADFCLRVWPQFAPGIPIGWLPYGIAVAILAGVNTRLWPGLVLGTGLLLSSRDAAYGSPLLVSAMADVVAAPLTVALLCAWKPLDSELPNPEEFLKMLMVGAVGALIAMPISAFGVAFAPTGTTFPPNFIALLWANHTLGLILAAPAILLTRAPQRLDWNFSRGDFLNLLLFTFALALVAQFIAEHRSLSAAPGHFPYYLLFPFIVWWSLSFGKRTTAVATLLLLSALLMREHLTAGAQGISGSDLYPLWLLCTGVGIMAPGVSIVLHERRQIMQALAESEANFRSIADSPGHIIWVADTRWHCLWVNSEWNRFSAMSTADTIAGKWRQRLHPDDLKALDERALVALRESGPFGGEVRVLNAAGAYRTLAISAVPRQDARGSIIGYTASFWDVTVEHELAAELAQREAILRAIYDSSTAGIAVVDAGGRMSHANQRMIDLFGYARKDLERLEYRDLLAPDPDALSDALRNRRQLFRKEKERFEGERIFRRHDGSTFWGHLTARPMLGAQHRVEGLVVTISDITQQKISEAQVLHQAHYDFLTDLPNRSLLYERLALTSSTARRYQRQFALVFIDLDNFKPINDRYGHDAGDALLREVADRLKRNIRSTDTAARHGGDEFVVLMPEVNGRAEVRTLAEKLIRVIGTPIDIGRAHVVVTPSLGASIFPEDGENVDDLVIAADQAMYRAKRAGRAQVIFHSETAEGPRA